MIDLTGRSFGLWTVVASAGSDKYGRKRWLCRCSCGKERIVSGHNLISGKSVSCGHTRLGKRRKDLTGMRFGRLTVLSTDGKHTGGNLIWTCRCECGNECNVASNNLQNGHTQSCGCQKAEAQQDANTRVAALKASPNTGRFETNINAKYFAISNGVKTWHIRNLANFVREHAALFDIDGSDDHAVCRTAKALYDAAYRHYAWHGWRVAKEDNK